MYTDSSLLGTEYAANVYQPRGFLHCWRRNQCCHRCLHSHTTTTSTVASESVEIATDTIDRHVLDGWTVGHPTPQFTYRFAKQPQASVSSAVFASILLRNLWSPIQAVRLPLPPNRWNTHLFQGTAWKESPSQWSNVVLLLSPLVYQPIAQSTTTAALATQHMYQPTNRTLLCN